MTYSEQFLNQADPRDLRNIILQQGQQIEEIRQAILTIQRVSGIAGEIGDLDYRAVNENGELVMIMSALNLLEENGIDAYFAGFNPVTKTPQIWINAVNGKVTAGGGDVTIGDDGTIIVDHVPLELKARNNFVGDLYSSYIFAENSLGGLVLISNARRGNPNLIVDGDFESGSLSSWNVASANAALVSDHVYEGNYALCISPAAVPYHAIYSAARFAVTAGKTYLVQLYTDRDVDAADFIVEIQYYDAPTGGPLLTTDQVLREDRSTNTWQRSICLPSVAPAGATHARIRIQLGASASTWIDGISLVDAGDIVWMEGTSNGWKVYKNGVASDLSARPHCPVVMGDEMITSVPNFTRTRNTSQPYGYLYSITSVTDAHDGDEYFGSLFCEAGTYTLHHLALTANNRGKADYYIDGVLVGSGVDWYSASTVYAVEKTVLNVKIPTSGYHVLKIKVNGKTGSGYVLDFTKVWLLPAGY